MTMTSPSRSKISVVIPVYRSAESLEILINRLHQVLPEMGRDFEIICVDDRSPDDTWTVLTHLKHTRPNTLKIARLLVNTGQHTAILCGFSFATGDIVVTMDDDLQNPPEEIPKLVCAIDQGYDLAIGAYESKKHPRLRNLSGAMIDLLLRHIFGLPSGFQLTSFRAAKRIVVDSVCQMSGVFPYITAMLLSNASHYTNIDVRHDERLLGESTYSLGRSLTLAMNLIFSYSSYPLYVVAVLCILAFSVSMSFGILTVYRVWTYGTSVPGWASTVVIVSLFHAFTLLCLCVFGVYISRINQQLTRTRLSYTVSELHE